MQRRGGAVDRDRFQYSPMLTPGISKGSGRTLSGSFSSPGTAALGQGEQQSLWGR